MELHSPLISIVVPAYNAEDTLRDTLRSAAAGSYRNIEIILVDDGSTDSTSAIAEDLAAKDSRIKIIRRENGGLSAALNSGFAVATGQYIARLDADDLWHPSKLEAQIDFARRHPGIAFVYTFVRYIDEADRVTNDGPRQEFPRWALCRGIYESVVGGGSSALIKRSAIEEAGGCNESFRNWEDLLLQLAISERHTIGFVPLYLVGYRVTVGSLSKDIDNMLRGWRAARTLLVSRFGQVPRSVHAWSHGTRCAMFAEGYAWRRRYLMTAVLLFEAFRHDPAWTVEFLRFRLARRASRMARHTDGCAKSVPFSDCDPSRRVTVDPFETHPAQQKFVKFESDRAQMLEQFDRQLAEVRSLELAKV